MKSLLSPAMKLIRCIWCWKEISVSSSNGEEQFTVIDSFEAGDLTGKLPFSRLQSSLAYVTVMEESTVLITHEDKFPEIASHYKLIESFVHALSDRIRHFTTQQTAK